MDSFRCTECGESYVHTYKCSLARKCDECGVRTDVLPTCHSYTCSYARKCECGVRMDVGDPQNQSHCAKRLDTLAQITDTEVGNLEAASA